MADFVPVCHVDDLPPGNARAFTVHGKEIALARTDTGDFHAVGGRCTHLRGLLGEGSLDGTVLTCPHHGSQFDVTTGRLLVWVPAPPTMHLVASLTPGFLRRSIPVYEVRIDNNTVFVKV